jgi:transposase
MARPSPYPPELRERAVRMVAEVRPNYPTEWAAMKAVAAKLGIGAAETVRTWVRKAEVDAGQRPGTTSQEAAEIKRLRAENSELRRSTEIGGSGLLLRVMAGLGEPGHQSYRWARRDCARHFPDVSGNGVASCLQTVPAGGSAPVSR